MKTNKQWLFGFFLVLGCTGDDAGSDGAGSDTGTSGGTAMTAPGDDGNTSNADTVDPSTSNATTVGADSTGDPMSDSSGDDPTTGDPTAESGSEGGSSSGGTAGATVTGTVFRSATTAPGFGGDAIGDIYIGLLVACDANAESIASGLVMNGDLSDSAVGVPYTVEDVPDGTYYATGFMDDNGNVDPRDVNADQGDIAAAQGFGPACVQVDVVDGAAVSGIDITLNLVVPF